ncbi:MAG: (Fe-S)-binding protein [Pseudomonadota bacterium]
MDTSNQSAPTQTTKPSVGLFVTCLVDLFRPNVGFSAVDLLEKAGCTVDVPPAQTCCGQPAYNSGDRADTRAIAEQVIKAFEHFDFVVAPSGSCAAMLKKHYPELFAGDPDWEDRATRFSDKVFELISFLNDVMFVTDFGAKFEGSVTYHDSCSGLRELGIARQPRTLLSKVESLEIREMENPDVCCGFGGTFCVKYSDISNAIVAKKTDTIEAAGADMVLAGDLGCLMNMSGKLKREGKTTKARHVAEVLAGRLETPALGESE